MTEIELSVFICPNGNAKVSQLSLPNPEFPLFQMNNKIRVLLLATNSHISLDVARCLGTAKTINLRVFSSERWPLARFSRYCSSFTHQSRGINDDQLLDQINIAADSNNADIIMAADETTIKFLSVHAKEVSQFVSVAATPDFDTFELVRNKWSLASFARNHNIPHPKTVLLTNTIELELEREKMGFPILIKPVSGSGGEDIQIFHNQQHLLDFISGNPQRRNEFIVQEYIWGFDVDCSVLCDKGQIRAYTIQQGFLHDSNPFRPSPGINFVVNPKALDSVTKLISELNWSGIAHIDLRFNKETGEVNLLEINPRYWGSLLGSLFIGVNFPYLHCLQSLGLSFSHPSYKQERYIFRNGITLKHWAKRLKDKSKIPISLRESKLLYSLRDPLPEVVNLTMQARGSLRKKAQSAMDGVQGVSD